eukprot:2545915-Pyramimonas_sp.AAC.1
MHGFPSSSARACALARTAPVAWRPRASNVASSWKDQGQSLSHSWAGPSGRQAGAQECAARVSATPLMLVDGGHLARGDAVD